MDDGFYGVLDCGYVVADEDYCAVGVDGVEESDELVLAVVVYVCGGFVEHEQSGLADECACHEYSLTLSA